MDLNIIDVTVLENNVRSFIEAQKAFLNNRYDVFRRSYVSSCSDSRIQQMKTKLDEKYRILEQGYQSIILWCNDYLDEVKAVEFKIAQLGGSAFSTGELSSFAQKFSLLESYDTSLSTLLNPFLIKSISAIPSGVIHFSSSTFSNSDTQAVLGSHGLKNSQYQNANTISQYTGGIMSGFSSKISERFNGNSHSLQQSQYQAVISKGSAFDFNGIFQSTGSVLGGAISKLSSFFKNNLFLDEKTSKPTVGENLLMGSTGFVGVGAVTLMHLFSPKKDTKDTKATSGNLFSFLLSNFNGFWSNNSSSKNASSSSTTTNNNANNNDDGISYSALSEEEQKRFQKVSQNENSRWSRHTEFSYSQEEIEEMIRKVENNEPLFDDEARFLSGYYESKYHKEYESISNTLKLTQEAYDKVKQVGSQYDFEKIEANQEEMKQQGLLEASSYIDSYRNGTLSLSVLGISRSELLQMNDEELKELILEKNPVVGVEYKEMMNSFQESGYQSSKDFQKNYQDVSSVYENQKNYQHMLWSTMKNISYFIDQKSLKFRNYKQENSVDVKGLKSIHYRESNTDGVYVDYKEYVSKYGEIDAYHFYKSAVEVYGKDVNVEGIKDIDLIKKLVEASEVDTKQGEYYAYLVETRGENAGSKYLKAIEEGLNQVCGEIEAVEFLDSLANLNEEARVKAVTNHLSVTGKELTVGVGGFFQNAWYGIEGLFQKEENRIYSKSEYETMYLTQAFLSEKDKIQSGLVSVSENGKKVSTSSLIDYTADYGKYLNHNLQISQSIGNMLPSIGISILNPIAGSGAMGFSAGGSGFHSAMVEGYDKSDAIAYGTVNGISEVAMEKLLGGIPILSDTKVFNLKTLGKAMMSEGFEEFVQSYVEAGAGTYILKKDFDFKETTQEAIQSGIYGAITGGIMNIPSLAINSHNMKVVDSKVKSGEISEADFVSAMHDILPDTKDMNYQQILEEYSSPSKEVALQLEEMNGKNVSNNVTSKLSNKFSESLNSILAKMSVLSDKAIQSKNKFENAFGNEMKVVTSKLKELTNSPSFQLHKVSLKSLPKVPLEFFYMIPTFFTKLKYDPVSKSSNVSNRILNQGLYHLTNLESVPKIFDSGYIKKSSFSTSYGSKKAFFFSGIPNLGDVATNLSNVSETQVAIKIDVDESEVNKFRYRAFNDQIIVYDGDYHFDSNKANLVYLGLQLTENGRLEYKEISKSEFDKINQNTPKGFIYDTMNLLKAFPIAWDKEFSLIAKNLEKVFNKSNVDATKAKISSKTSSILQSLNLDSIFSQNSSVFSSLQDFFKKKNVQATGGEVSSNVESLALKNIEVDESSLKNRLQTNISSSVSAVSSFVNSLVEKASNLSILNLPERTQKFIKQISEDSDFLALKAFTESLISAYQTDDADTKKIVQNIDVLNLSGNSFSVADDLDFGTSKFMDESKLSKNSFLYDKNMYILNEVGNGFQVMSHEMGHMLWGIIDGKSLPNNFEQVMTTIRDGWINNSSKIESFLNEAREYKEKLWSETNKEADLYMENTKVSFQESLNELFLDSDNLRSQLELAAAYYEVSLDEVERMLQENDKKSISDLLFRYNRSQYVQNNFYYKCDNDSSMQIYDTVAGIVDSIFNGNNPYYSTIYDNGFLRGHQSDYFQSQTTNSFDEQFADFTRMKFYDMKAVEKIILELCGNEWMDMMNQKYHEIATKMENGVVRNSLQEGSELRNMDVETLRTVDSYSYKNSKKIEDYFSQFPLLGRFGCNQDLPRVIVERNLPRSSDLIQIVQNYFPSISFDDASKLISNMNGKDFSGICDYAAIVNTIVNTFKNNPLEFEEHMGYSLTRVNEVGYTLLNDDLLLLDLFCFVNKEHLSNSSNEYKVLSHEKKSMNPNNDFSAEFLSNWLKSKKFDYSVSYDAIFNNYSVLPWQKGLDIPKEELNSYLIHHIENALALDSVVLTVDPTRQGSQFKWLTLETSDGASLPLNGSHVMTVLGILDENHLIVDSWGQKCVVDLNEMIEKNMSYSVNVVRINKN